MLKPLSFGIGGKEFMIKTKKLFIEYDYHCLFTMQINEKEDKWIIGNAFLFNYLSSFDIDDKTVTLYSYNEIYEGKKNNGVIYNNNIVDMHTIIKGLSMFIICSLIFNIAILGIYKFKYFI